MRTERFHLSVDAPVGLVWELLTDYAGYARFPGVKWARVAEPGKDHPAGVGALRELEIDGVTFSERIIEFEPQRMLAYRIERSSPLPVRHEIGRMRLTARPGGTELDWETTFEVGVPVLGPLLTPIVARKLRRTFETILAFTRRELEQRARAAGQA